MRYGSCQVHAPLEQQCRCWTAEAIWKSEIIENADDYQKTDNML
jgi:hypothetical protein